MDRDSIRAASVAKKEAERQQRELDVQVHNARVALWNHVHNWERSYPGECRFDIGDGDSPADNWSAFMSDRMIEFVRMIELDASRAARLKLIVANGTAESTIAADVYSMAMKGHRKELRELLYEVREVYDHSLRDVAENLYRYQIPSMLIDGPRIDEAGHQPSVVIESPSVACTAPEVASLPERLDQAWHFMSIKQKPPFKQLQGMKPVSFRNLSDGEQGDEAVAKMLGRMDEKLLEHTELLLTIHVSGNSAMLQDLATKNGRK